MNAVKELSALKRDLMERVNATAQRIVSLAKKSPLDILSVTP